MAFNIDEFKRMMGGDLGGLGDHFDTDSTFNSSDGSWNEKAFVKGLSPSVHFANPAEVRRQAQARSKNIFSTFETLSNILLRHEATIQKRWAKKTRQQRQKILLSAWPGMATTHRPDFDAFRRASKSSGKSPSEVESRECFIWPHINQEDLLKPKTLLLLLNARGRHLPPAFAGADFEAMHFGVVTKKLTPDYLNGYTMIMHGVSDPREYGKLLSWDDHEDAFDWMVTLKQSLPGEGLMVLEAQERLLRFLVDCCHQILGEIPAEDILGPKFPTQPEPSLKTEKESSGFDSLVVMASEAPYRLPSQLDFGRIESVLEGRVAAAEDHLWGLREDPSYFMEEMIEVKEHRQELLKDTNGDIHPVLKTVRQDKFWGRICGCVAFEAFMKLEIFAELHRQAQALRKLHEKHAAEISPSKDLPEELLAAFLKFRHYLMQAAKGALSTLREGVVASPPWRSYFIRQPPPDSTTSKIVVQSKPGNKMNDIEEQLLWLLRTLWDDGQMLQLARLELVVDELGRLIETEPRAQNMLSARIDGVVGDLAIISQCLSQLALYHPWARGFEHAMAERLKDVQGEFARRTKTWGDVMAALNERNLTAQVAKLGNPSDKKFAYPIEKRRTKENVEALRRAEKNLDDFWTAIDRVVYAKCGRLEGSDHQRVLAQSRIMRRTPEWVEPLATTKSGRQAVLDPELADLYRPLSTIYIGEPTGKKDASITPASKPKTKTRDTADPAAAAASQPTVATVEEHEPARASIGVDSRSLKVFRTIFFNPAVTSSPGEVSWTEFLHAMTANSLFAAEKLYGSVWQFQRLEGDQSRIQFHEPHPRGKIPFTTARRHGRRLHRAFGWSGDTFTLREK